MRLVDRTISLLLLVALLAGFLPTPARAAPLEISFEQTPLFEETSFVPGERMSRFVRVTNNGFENMQIFIAAFNIIDEYSLGDYVTLGISQGEALLYENSLTSFLNEDRLFLSELSPEQTTEYLFSATLGLNVDNTLQGKTLSFDIRIDSSPFLSEEKEMASEETLSEAPRVLAIWHMKDKRTEKGFTGEDDSEDPGMRFFPSGKWEQNTPLVACAAVTDANGIDDIEQVSATISYPANRAFGMASTTPADVLFGGTETNPDYGAYGCGLPKEETLLLNPVSDDENPALLCDTIRAHNANLPEFFNDATYNTLCNAEGLLAKGDAEIVCAAFTLSFDDPAGAYTANVRVRDDGGLESDVYQTAFHYLELTSFDIDFTSLNYGEVELGAKLTLSGDTDFKTQNAPSIRNSGNTRFYITLTQDDMGLGKTGENWNIEYSGYTGTEADNEQSYFPYEKTALEDIVDLGALEPATFTLTVHSFDGATNKDQGSLTLNAKPAEYRQCEEPSAN